MVRHIIWALVVGSSLSAGCDGACASAPPVAEQAMELTSPTFTEGGTIPVRHTCDGEDVSPALSFANVPERAQAFALIVDDPDAPNGTWVHWVYFDLPGEVREIAEGAGAPLPPQEGGPRHGRNDFSRYGWGGPCPPPGPAHRYEFTLYALDAPLGLGEGVDKAAVVAAMRDHVLAEANLAGRYARAE